MIASESTPAPPTGFACGEVRGGNGTIHAQVALPGLRGVLYSRPCAGASGGDIHYLSVCGSGLLARVCLADVAWHGSAVAAVGTEMHASGGVWTSSTNEKSWAGSIDASMRGAWA